jgi:hypothetical protein
MPELTSPEPDGRLPGEPPRRGARWWIGAVVAAAVFVTGMVFLLLPVTTVYYLDDHGNPYDVRSLYATRSDQMLLLPADLLDKSTSQTAVTSVRLGCGTAFSGPDSKLSGEAHGEDACSTAEQTRTIVGWLGVGLGLLGAAGLVAARRAQVRANAAQTHLPPSAGS